MEGPKRNTAPMMPAATPRNPFLDNLLLNNIAPTTKVNMGVNALRMPDNPLGMRVPAVENKNAGMALPTNPVMKR